MDVLNTTLSIVASVLGIVAAVLAIYIAWEEHKKAKESKMLKEPVGHVKSDQP